MKRTLKIFFEDILNSIEKIEKYTKRINFRGFTKNNLIIDGVIRNLEIIGEASKNIPKDIREKYHEIPWKRMIGLRNIVVHEYFGVDTSIVWKIITKNLPGIKENIKEIIKEIK